MGKLRDNTKQAVAELEKLGQRFGMETTPDIPNEIKVNFAEMSLRAEESMTSMMSVYMPPPTAGETKISPEISLVGPKDQSKPQSRHFTRMVARILTKNGVTEQGRKPLGDNDDRKLTFTVTEDNAENLATALKQLNAYLDSEKAQETAAHTLLTKAAAIEETFTDKPAFTRMTKVMPTFEVTEVKDSATAQITKVPIFGVSIETNDPALIHAGKEAKSNSHSINMIPNIEFSRVDDPRHRHNVPGTGIKANGDALETLLTEINKSRDVLQADLEAKSANKKREGTQELDIDSDSNALRSVQNPHRPGRQ